MLAEAAAGIGEREERGILIEDGKWRFTKEGEAPALRVKGFGGAPKIDTSIRERGLEVLTAAEAAIRRGAATAGPGNGQVTTDFIDCSRFDAFFWNWPAIEKFVLPYYIRLRGYGNLESMVSDLKARGVVGILHGDYSVETSVSDGAARAGYFTVRAQSGTDGTRTLLIEPL